MNIVGNLDQYMKYQTAESIRDAANNPVDGSAGAGFGLSAGMAMGQMIDGMNPSPNNANANPNGNGNANANANANAKLLQASLLSSMRSGTGGRCKVLLWLRHQSVEDDSRWKRVADSRKMSPSPSLVRVVEHRWSLIRWAKL